MTTVGDAKEALRSWVTAQDDKEFFQSPEGWVRLEVSSEYLRTEAMTANNFQNFPLDMTIPSFKAKLQLTVGIAPIHQKLHLLNAQREFVCAMDNDSLCVGHYKPRDGWMVFVYDADPFRQVGKLQDFNEAPKFVMSDEEYRARKGTFREWKLANPDEYMKHFGHLHQPKPGARQDEDGKEEAERMSVGQRCRIVGDRRGEVKFVGKVKFGKGYWVGIHLDEPMGKHDGTVKEVHYFDCPAPYGLFMKAEEVEVGDFPPLDPFAEEAEESKNGDEI